MEYFTSSIQTDYCSKILFLKLTIINSNLANQQDCMVKILGKERNNNYKMYCYNIFILQRGKNSGGLGYREFDEDLLEKDEENNAA